MGAASTDDMVGNSATGIFLVAVLVLVGYFAIEKFTTDLVYITSPHDGRVYLVRNLPDREDAAMLLSKLRQKLVQLTKQMQTHYPHDKRVRLLLRRYNPDDMSEVAADSRYTSYSVNKGEKIVYCIRSRDDREELVDLNTILFVALHELAHVMTISVGHTSEFWENFRFLLAHAVHWRVYRSVNFRKKPTSYCGTYITDSPLDNVDMRKYVNYNSPVSEENDAVVMS